MLAICALLSRKLTGSNPIKSRKAIKRLNRRRVNGKPRSLFRETRREKHGSRRRNDRRRRQGEEGGKGMAAARPSVSGLKTYILVLSCLRVAFIRLRGKSSPINVMGVTRRM